MLSDFQIQEAYLVGQIPHPGVSLSFESFAALVRARQVDPGDLKTSAADFFLTSAAGDGDSKAIRVVEERFVPQLTKRILRLGSPPDRVPDVLQTIRERLFTGPNPRIRTYNAAVPLEQWIRVVTIRMAIDLHRREAALPRGDEALAELVTFYSPDAAALVMKSEYGQEFEEAFRAELTGLPAKDRTILRLHVVEGVSIEKIAVMYRVHRVTVARWVWIAGEAVLDGLRRRFQDKFGVPPGDFDSLARLLRSQLSLRLDELLTESPDPPSLQISGKPSP